MNNKNFVWGLIILLIIITGAFIAYAMSVSQRNDLVQPPVGTTPVACTLEAKICPDGSAVGRVGPNCDFAPCPGEPRY